MTPHEVTSQWWDHATMWNADDPTLDLAGHTTDGGRVFGITRLRYDECAHYGCKPVVVIDPSQREQVALLLSHYHSWKWRDEIASASINDMQAALREFANPKPPKPEEPTGLGAVVEDERGRKYVRVAQPFDGWMKDRDWQQIGGDMNAVRNFGWSDLDIVRVLSEGVPL